MTYLTRSSIDKKYSGVRVLLDIRRDPLKFFLGLMHQHGAGVWLKIRGKPLLMLNDATGIKHVLQDNSKAYRKGRFHQFLKPLFGDSIFLSEGYVWRKQRENAAPVFSNKNFPDMVTQMVGAMEAMFHRWEHFIEEQQPIDLALEMTSFTLDALLRALFHDAQNGVASTMRSALDIILTDTEDRMWSSFSIPEFIAHKLPQYAKSRRFLRDLVENLIDHRRKYNAYPSDLLSRLIANYNLSSTDQTTLYYEVLAYLLSGHDTTAHGLSWSFYTLAHNPEHNKKMYDEINRVLGSDCPNVENLKHLTYTRQIFDEVLRLYPPVWSISREVAEDDDIPLDNNESLKVKTGDGIMMCHYAVHRRPLYWDNPELFDPERFAPQNVERRQPYSWFPFGGGPRLCIGFRFAQMESLVALSMISQRYELFLVPGQTIKPLPIITLRPDSPILFHIKKRQDFKGQDDTKQASKSDEARCPYNHVA